MTNPKAEARAAKAASESEARAHMSAGYAASADEDARAARRQAELAATHNPDDDAKYDQLKANGQALMSPGQRIALGFHERARAAAQALKNGDNA